MKLSRGDLTTLTSKDNKAPSKPVKLPTISSPVLKAIHRFLMPVVVSPFSNQMVADFQGLCGIKADGTISVLPLKYFFKLCSTAGEEIFGLMPFLIYASVEVGYAFATNFGIMLTIGQMTKDLLFLPRPPVTWPKCTRPILKLEKHFETEYGFPSTHAMSGLLPLSCFLALSRRGVDVSDNWWVFCAVYSTCVALSRLYMGVHSVLDVVGGTLYGLIFIFVLHQWGDIFDDFSYTHPYGIVVPFVGLLMFITLYPRTKPWSASFGTAAQFFGTWLGLSFSFWFANVIMPEIGDMLRSLSLLHPQSLTTNVSGFAIRGLVAMIIVGFNKVFVKWWATKLFLQLRKTGFLPIDPEEEVDVHGNKIADNKTYWIEVPMR